MKIFPLLTCLLLAACSNGKVGKTTNELPPDNTNAINPDIVEASPLVYSSHIVADNDFEFRIDRDLLFIIEPPNQVEGVAHIYGSSDPNAPADFPQPDYLSRITSINPAANPTATFNFTGLDSFVWVHWTPTSAQDLELLFKVPILQNKLVYSVQLSSPPTIQ